MSFFSRVVVGIDYRGQAPPASDADVPHHVRRAFTLAEATRCPIELLSVLPEAKAGWFVSEDEARRQSAENRDAASAYLQQLAQRHGGQSERGAQVETSVAHGDAWLEIMKAAGPDGRGLIVCATRAHNPISRVLFGSTGMKLLRYAPGPVWLVHPQRDQDDMFDVLGTSDLSEQGQRVIEVSVDVARILTARLHLLSVAENGCERLSTSLSADSAERERIYREAEAECERRLQEQVAQTDYRTLEHGVMLHAATGDADTAILEAVDNLKTNLVVIGTRARGGAAGMVLGNTAERLLTSLPCSVLAIKPEGFECPVSLT